MEKRIFREDVKRDQEETQDRQRSILSIRNPRHSEQHSDFTKIQSPRLKRHKCHSNRTSLSLSLTRYSFFLSFVCYLLSHKRVLIKTIFCCLLKNEFSLFFELLSNLATHITWPSEEDPAELCHHPCARRGSFKHSVGTEGFDKANSRKLMW